MNEIGVFLEEGDIISSFEDARYIKVFTKDKFEWKAKKIILINRRENRNGINEIREEYRSLIKEIDDCKIIIVKKAFGIPYSVFYMEDFSVWELEGNPYDFLDEIIEREIEEESVKEEKEFAEELEGGYYLIDLLKLELINPEISSKKAIVPYLEKDEVKKIQVNCCHVPPWLISKKEKGEIGLEINEIGRNNYKVIIVK